MRTEDPFAFLLWNPERVIFIPQELKVAAGAPVFSLSPLLAKSGGRKEAKRRTGGSWGREEAPVCEAVCERQEENKTFLGNFVLYLFGLQLRHTANLREKRRVLVFCS